MKQIGILTAGGDTPGLNAAIRAIGKTAINQYDWKVIGFREGFRGLVQNRFMRLDRSALSGLLTVGGTILGTSRDKPHKMPVGNKTLDMTDVIVENYEKHGLDCLICLGGGGTQKNAYRLHQKGLNIITLPKTIDNDIGMTDISFGYDTALGIATDSLDRLHTTAHSHHRIIVVEIMGHRAGWLALGAGVAGGADVILIPEIPYDMENIADAIRFRMMHGKPFSIVAVAEGALTQDEASYINDLVERSHRAKNKAEEREIDAQIKAFQKSHRGSTLRLANKLEELTGLESRMTILGHVQRGGAPSARDRMLATRLGTEAADMVASGCFGHMLAIKGENIVPVPLEEVAGKKKLVPINHPQVISAKRIGTCFGDE